MNLLLSIADLQLFHAGVSGFHMLKSVDISSGFTVVNDYIMDRTVIATLLKFSCQLVD